MCVLPLNARAMVAKPGYAHQPDERILLRCCPFIVLSAIVGVSFG
jgi:hypothetical protein